MSFLPGKIAVTCFYLQPCNPPPFSLLSKPGFLCTCWACTGPPHERFARRNTAQSTCSGKTHRHRGSATARLPARDSPIIGRSFRGSLFRGSSISGSQSVSAGVACLLVDFVCLRREAQKKSVLVANQVKSLAPIISYYKEWRMAPRESLRSVRVN